MLVEDVRAKLTIKNNPNIIGEPTYKATNELRTTPLECAKNLGAEDNGDGKISHPVQLHAHQHQD